LFEICHTGRDFVEVLLDEVGIEGSLEVRRHLGSLTRKETIVCRGKGYRSGLDGSLVLFTLFELLLLC
jgi:hypothetical protein